MESSSSDGAAATVHNEREGLLALVDPFLVEALENPRHRLTVLRMELDIQRFLQSSDQLQFEFQHLPTSYLRRVAHRVAQHYGLQTIALDNTIDGLCGRVLARKTSDSKFPAICLSEVPAKQSENGMNDQVKIAIRPRPSKASSADAAELGNRKSSVRTVEERKEEYDKARARIFSSSGSTDVEDFPSMAPADVRNSYPTRDEQECPITVYDIERISLKDGVSRVAIFRDREKDRIDPDYDRSYDRYVRSLTPVQNLGFRVPNIPNMFQPPYLQYEAGNSQLDQMLRNQAPISYRPSNPAMSPYCAFGCNQPSPKDVVYHMQWPNPAMMYANTYQHFRHAVVQAPFYQHPLSFDHPQNC